MIRDTYLTTWSNK